MPPKGRRPRISLSSQVETEVVTRAGAKTSTRVVIALVIGLVLGLAAYGYGYGFSLKKNVPLLKAEQVIPAPPEDEIVAETKPPEKEKDSCLISPVSADGSGRCYPGCVTDADCTDKAVSATLGAYVSVYSDCRDKVASICKGDSACVDKVCGPEQAICVKGTSGSTCSRPNFGLTAAQCANTAPGYGSFAPVTTGGNVTCQEAGGKCYPSCKTSADCPGNKCIKTLSGGMRCSKPVSEVSTKSDCAAMPGIFVSACITTGEACMVDKDCPERRAQSGQWLGQCKLSNAVCMGDAECVDSVVQSVGLQLSLGEATGPEFSCSPENASAPLIDFYQATDKEALEFATQRFAIEAIDGGYVKGSAGTPYFTNIRLVDTQTYSVIMGPIELLPSLTSSSSNSGVMSLTGPFALNGSQMRKYVLLAKIACKEDSPGELNGRKFRVVKQVVQNGEVKVQATGAALDLSRVKPLANLEGVPFKVVAK